MREFVILLAIQFALGVAAGGFAVWWACVSRKRPRRRKTTRLGRGR